MRVSERRMRLAPQGKRSERELLAVRLRYGGVYNNTSCVVSSDSWPCMRYGVVLIGVSSTKVERSLLSYSRVRGKAS